MFDNDFDEKLSDFLRAQCFISKDVLKIFKWLIEYEQDSLRKIIIKAIKKGIKNDYKDKNIEHILDLNNYLLDFFILLENILYEISSNDFNSDLDRKLLSIIDKFDSNQYNIDDIESSISKVNNDKNVNKSNEQLKSLLCKELLKRWRPAKKEYDNN